MDFPVEEAIRQALENDGAGWGNGMTRVYDALAMDGLYANTNNLLLFVGNHDMDRFADVVKDNDPRRVVIGHVLMATMRGIPQLYAGDEYAQRSADITMGHSGLRQPLPTQAELTDEQIKVYKQISHLLQWRQKEPVIWKGSTMHFMSRDNTYAYFRYLDDEAVFVFINAAEEERVIPTKNYQEILSRYNPTGIDVMTDEKVDLLRDDIKMEPLSYLVVKLSK
jgi:glycosidase